MKESSEDIIIKNIKEVLEKYEPEYSPQFWENLRKQRLDPESWLTKLFLNYRFYLSCLVITGFLIIVNTDTSVQSSVKYPATDTVFPESSHYSASEKPKEIKYPQKTVTFLSHSVSDGGSDQEETVISSNVTTVPSTDISPPINQDYTQTGESSEEIPYDINKAPFEKGLFGGADFLYQVDNSHLIPIKSNGGVLPVLKTTSAEKTRTFKFQWPVSGEALEGSYDKFAGPNRVSVFYSPEIHYSDSLGTLGFSQGAGISLEGLIRSSVSVSAGLSYQSMNFDVTIFSAKVPPEGPFEPSDTLEPISSVDSIEIRSGSYNFLELPVAVNFKFLESVRSQVLLSAGISAIAFLKQNYTYETVVGGISNSSSVSVSSWEDIHPLASINFGLVYRYKLSDRFFLHGSAQYKQHLVALGYNSMKLNRLNFQAGIIYRFGH
jgi:hypothetical protein